MNIVILLGAGASYGAFDEPTLRPPLGDELFARLTAAYPDTWGCLPEHVASEFSANEFGFENGMAALWQEGKATQAALVDMSVYFAGFRIHPGGTNHYVDLFRVVDHFKDSLSFTVGSLNYECLVEQTLSGLGYNVVLWGSPSHGLSRPVRLIKPHGSCNYVADFGTNTFKNITIQGQGQYVAGPVKCVHLDQVAQARVTGFPSVMSLYAPGKPDIMCPDFVNEMRKDWSDAVASTDVVLVIGARPAVDNDPHIWVPIVESTAQVLFVGQPDDPFRKQLGGRFALLSDKFKSGLGPLAEWLGSRLG